MNNYRQIIGLEVHVELKTFAKMFCQCPANYFGKPANSQTCPVCLGLPGALPVPNQKAVEWTILLGKALNCQINKISKFDRKHYFYPDLPKGYQISQYDEPIAINGNLVILSGAKNPAKRNTAFGLDPSVVSLPQDDKKRNQRIKKVFRIRRVHLEEDTGKLIHKGNETLIDFNRSGVPLVEIVTEPDFENSNDVKRFLEEVQTIIRYLEISDCDMEKGTMRLEPNISVKKIQDVGTGHCPVRTNVLPSYKVEVKNINSFRFVKQAIDYEVKRQIELLEKGQTPTQETRGFDEKKCATYSQRTKEEAQDYRYFPEPDIPPFTFSKKYIDSIKVPELPHEKIERYVSKMELRYHDAFVLTRDRKIADYFENINEKLSPQMRDPATAGQLKIKNLEQTVANFIINRKISTDLSDIDFIEKIIQIFSPKEVDKEKLNQLIKINKKAVEDYKKGKQNALMFLVGQVMREMRGKVDAKVVMEELKEKLT